MKHIRLDKVASTQQFLRDNINQHTESSLIVSTLSQTDGMGRRSNRWITFKNALAFSFTLSPNEIETLTSLEVGLQICRFIKSEYKKDIYVKWPNDILNNKGEKLGGIIAHKDEKTIIVGIGLNFGLIPQEINENNERYDISNLLDVELDDLEKHTIPYDFYNYILSNRFSAEDVYSQWDQSCLHTNKTVNIEDGKDIITGPFQGIGKWGQAIINTDKGLEERFSGSLTIC